MNSHDLAFEVTQEVFTMIWARREVITFTSLSGFVFSCVRIQILRHVNSEKLKHKYYPEIARFCIESVVNSTEETIMLHDLEGKLSNSLAGLPKRCQEIFRMSRQQNLSIKEIAQQLNLSHKTVENQLTSALKHLRVSLGEFMVIVLLFFY